MLNKGDYISFSVLFSAYLRTTDHLILKLWIFRGFTASFKIEISKVQDFGNFLSWSQLFIEQIQGDFRTKLGLCNRKIIFSFLKQNKCCGYSKEPSG